MHCPRISYKYLSIGKSCDVEGFYQLSAKNSNEMSETVIMSYEYDQTLSTTALLAAAGAVDSGSEQKQEGRWSPRNSIYEVKSSGSC